METESIALDQASVEIRRATVDDARGIAVVATLGWQTAYRGILPDEFLDRLNVDSRERGWRTLLETDHAGRGATWVAARNRDTLGFVSSGPPRDDDAPPESIEIYAIYVLPSAWRSGIGRNLLETATAYWRERDAPELLLWVLEANQPARRFYEAQGWRPDGARQEFRLGDVSAMEVRYRVTPG